MWHIKKRSMCQTLALYLFIAPFFLNFLQDFLHLPGLVKYTLDIAWFGVLVCMLLMKEQLVYKKTLPILAVILGYVIYVSVVYVFRYQSIFYFLWGIRNNVRYFVAFLIFVHFLDKEDVQFCLRLIDVLFAVHIAVSLVQFFFMGYKWDYLGGIFGTELGCNGHSMILITVVTIKSLLMYMHGLESLGICLLKCSASFVIAAMAELKFFFVLFAVILVAAAVFTRFSAKKVLLIVTVSLVVFVAGNVFTAIWGGEHALSFERIIELATSTNYSSEKDLGRFTAIPIISETILIDVPKNLFGLGLGNCDTSSFAICNSSFYQAHSYLNYDWLSSAFCFIETGYVGMSIVLLFFVIVMLCAIHLKKRNTGDEMLAEMAIVMCIVCVALFFYNSSLRTDIGYVAYFVLALPFVSTSSETVFDAAMRTK